jgi:hypothetical protein
MKNIAIVKYFFLVFVLVLPRAAVADSHQTEAREDVASPSLSRSASQKIMIGEIEDVMLVPWSVTLPARIDTGATISSLDARNISVRNNIVAFMLGKEYGGTQLQLPVVKWVHVRSSVGIEKRPVVQIGMCLGPKLIRTVATLRDRSQMIYPVLIGRNVLNGSFVVDTSRAKAVAPACSSGSLSLKELRTLRSTEDQNVQQ